jgi:hypothetical protein
MQIVSWLVSSSLRETRAWTFNGGAHGCCYRFSSGADVNVT